MGERKGQNMYYPPDYDPKYGGLNKFQGTHALRERAKKLHLGILIIRFEMPYNIWCDGCGNHIGMGVRYNAEKTKVSLSLDTAVSHRNGIRFLLSGRHVLHDSGVPVQVQVPPLPRLHRDENGPREFSKLLTAYDLSTILHLLIFNRITKSYQEHDGKNGAGIRQKMDR